MGPESESVPLPHEFSPIQDLPTSLELRVYSRRKCDSQQIEPQAPPEQSQESNSDSLNEGNMVFENFPENNDANDDLNLAIALRKGVRSCTQHALHNYISYSGLPPNFRAFIANLDSVQVPTNIQEALNQPHWKNAVLKEIQALEKNNT